MLYYSNVVICYVKLFHLDAIKEEYLEKIRKLESELEIAKQTAMAASEKVVPNCILTRHFL